MPWLTTSEFPSLLSRSLHLWLVDTRHCINYLESYKKFLSNEELKRAERFVRAEDRERFIFSRAILRILLGKYLSLAPADVDFYYGKHGKPYVAPTVKSSVKSNVKSKAKSIVQGQAFQCDIEFNHSNSQAKLLYGFTRQFAVGVDIEGVRKNIDCLDLAKRNFAAEEYKALAALDKDIIIDGFYKFWTRKEAFIKAIGKGLHFSLHRFQVSTALVGEQSIMRIDSDEYGASEWALMDIPVMVNDGCNDHAFGNNDQYYAAVVTQFNPESIQYFKFLPEVFENMSC